MPIHDWTRADDGFYHSFHNTWATHLMEALNGGILPPGYFAMSDQRAGVFVPDVLAYAVAAPTPPVGGTATASRPKTDREVAFRGGPGPRAVRRVAVRTGRRVVAVIELVSPGNKDGPQSVREFVAKVADLVRGRVNVAVIDPLPPGRNDPGGLHPMICRALRAGRKAAQPAPADRPLTFAGYQEGSRVHAFLNYAAVGDRLPDVPLFLYGDVYVNLPLEVTYMAGFTRLPAPLREELE